MKQPMKTLAFPCLITLLAACGTTTANPINASGGSASSSSGGGGAANVGGDGSGASSVGGKGGGEGGGEPSAGGGGCGGAGECGDGPCDSPELSGIVAHVFSLAEAGDPNAELAGLFADDAIINESPATLLLGAVGPVSRSFAVGGQQVVERTDGACELTVNYSVLPGNEPSASVLAFRQDSLGAWKIERVTRSIPEAPGVTGARLRPDNPLREFFAGVALSQSIAWVGEPGDDALGDLTWSATLEAGATSYPLTITGPAGLGAFESTALTIESPACESRTACAAYPDLDLQTRPAATLRIAYASSGGGGEWELPVRVANGKQHKALYAPLVNPKVHFPGVTPAPAFSEYQVRFRVLRASRTYFAVLRFEAGYAGFIFNVTKPSDPPSQLFSVWNNPDVGSDLRNQFLNVNTTDGFTQFEKPLGGGGDQNFASIRHATLGWDFNREYTYRLTVEPIEELGAPTWTHFTLWLTAHPLLAGEQERTWLYGTIKRYGSSPSKKLSSFMEKLAMSQNELRQEIEYIAVKARIAGAATLTDIPIGQVEGDMNSFGEPFPGAAWHAREERLRVAAGGQTPAEPGYLLLDY